MQLRYRVALIVAAVMGVALTVMRLVWTPAGTAENGLYTATLFVIALSLVAMFLLCGMQPRRTIVSEGRLAFLMSAASAWAGASLLVYAISSLVDLGDNVYPYPQPVTATSLNQGITVVMIVSAALGSVFFLFTAVRWCFNRRTDRAAFGVLALLPVVWMWTRLLWYITSLASAVNRYRSVTETALLLFEMLFLLTFARYTSGVEEKAPRFAVPVALATAMLGLVSCMTRFGAYLFQDAELFSGTLLLTAPDAALALLAGAFAVQQIVAAPLPEPENEEEEEEPEEAVPVEDDVAEFILDMDAFSNDSGEEEDEEDFPVVSADERQPMELEDVIINIINRKS